MAKAKAIVKRRKAVGNIKKITRTMQLIATAKFAQCQGRAVASQPYTEKIAELVNQLSQQVKNVEHPLLTVNQRTGKKVLLVLTSNRGLCGGYNAQVLRAAIQHYQTAELEKDEIELDVSGKKGLAYFKFMGYPLYQSYSRFDDRTRFEQVEVLANGFIERYSRQQITSVHVAYMKFVSVARQRAVVVQLLPLRSAEQDGPSSSATEKVAVQYDFSPQPAELLAELLPASVRVQLYQYFMDAIVSEQIARMVAMKAATDAASDMVKVLTRTYNRARQTQITLELLDIIGGVNALA